MHFQDLNSEVLLRNRRCLRRRWLGSGTGSRVASESRSVSGGFRGGNQRRWGEARGAAALGWIPGVNDDRREQGLVGVAPYRSRPSSSARHEA
jgi:hypothetical protein